MIEVFKMIYGIDKINLRRLLCIDEDERTRTHSIYLKIRRNVNSNLRLKFITRRIINYWNQLTDEVVSSSN